MGMLFALFGGLAMFLYGMDRMSRALQRAAGDAMKRLLARLTATPLLGVLTGLAMTAVLQSSSAATVMVIGFVSAGLLELPRAVAVIYGINIGTTMTAQLIAFDVQTLVYPVLFLGFLLDFAARRPRWQAVGEAVFSFGLLFEGIDILGRALQPLAGQAVFLEWMTRVKESPLLGILLGLSMTMVVQSSSATTVMVIGFVSAGLMELPQAVAVVFGANVGTTMTAQLVAFRLADWVFPILFAGVLVWLLARRERTRQLGLAVFSFGLLFDGIEVLSGAMAPLAEHPVFLRWMTQVRHTPLLGLLLGTGMTLVVQSSSATIAVLQRAAQQAGPDGIHSVLGLAGALPILLGDNIGTTITAVLAAVGQPTDARRTAAAHCCFNLSGSVVCLLTLPWMTRLVEVVSPKGPELEVLARQIANAHTLFNLLCTLVWLPLTPVMVRLVCKLVPQPQSSR